VIFERAYRKCCELGLAFIAVFWLASCGSGAVGDSTPPAAPGPLAVVPGTATLYAGVPTTFLVTGGTGSFSLVSSDQNVIPNATSLSGSSFAVVANPVGSDTPVTLTILDSAGSQATVSLTVKPRTVGSTITITPTSSQSATCGTAICSGGDAEVTATLTLAGAPLVGRQVLFEAISGDFRFITSPAGVPETLANSVTAVTDSTGTARVRIRVLSTAAAQTALLQITDLGSGAFQRASFTIAVANTAVLSAQPSVINFRGLTSATCAANIAADVIVVGGQPPYSISNPGSFLVSPTTVTASGGRFTVTATGQCATGARIAVVDSVGASAVVEVNNSEGPGLPQSNPLVVGPTTLTLGTKCTSVGSVLVAGGVGTYFGVAGDPDLTVTIAGNTASISRSSSTVVGPKTVPIAISDGREVVTVQVTIPTGPCTP
jgi:hypothetical protein